jgi:hypothetical protein
MELMRVVSLIKTPVHLTKQYLHRRVDPNYRCNFVTGEEKSRAAELAETMRREGIVILPSYFQPPKLDALRATFERVVRNRINKYSPDSLWIDDIFSTEPVLLKAALDNFLLQIIGDYFQRKFGLGVAAATRLFPTPAHRDGSYQWHHDARSKQVNLMILLSNVTVKGQRMAYLRRSHQRYYDYYRGIVDTRFNEDVDADPQSRDRIVEVVGVPGTVALFDSNGLHSGNRNDVEPRDTLGINYVSHRRHTKKVRVRRGDLSALPPAKREVLTFNPNLELLD